MPVGRNPAAQMGLAIGAQLTEPGFGTGWLAQVALIGAVSAPVVRSVTVPCTSKQPVVGYGRPPGPGNRLASLPHRKRKVWDLPMALKAFDGAALTMQPIGGVGRVGVGDARGSTVGPTVPVASGPTVAVGVGLGVGVAVGTGPIDATHDVSDVVCCCGACASAASCTCCSRQAARVDPACPWPTAAEAGRRAGPPQENMRTRATAIGIALREGLPILGRPSSRLP